MKIAQRLFLTGVLAACAASAFVFDGGNARAKIPSTCVSNRNSHKISTLAFGVGENLIGRVDLR